MSAHVEVVSSDLKRAKVKVTPGTYLVDVLNEACKKLNLNSDKYLLKHKQKIVDLSGPWRTSGLSPGAKLELVQKSKSASVVSIALDVEGRRFTKKLPSDMTLWQVMRQFESTEQNLNITGRGVARTSNGVQAGSGQLYYEGPVVNIMGREYSALEDLQKTLSQCGINSGSIVLRVAFQNTDKTLVDAMQDIGQYLNDLGPGQATKEEPPKPLYTPAVSESTKQESGASVEAPGTEQQAAATEPPPPSEPTTTTTPNAPAEASTAAATLDLMDIDTETTPAAATTTSSGGAVQSEEAGPDNHLKPTSVFSAPTSSTPAAAKIREDDSVYEPSIAHAQLRQQQLQQRAQNTRLKSDEELAAEAAAEAARLAKITSVDVKIRFPDQSSAQWTINPHDTGAFLYRAVRETMAHPAEPFKIMQGVVATVTPGSKGSKGPLIIRDDDKPLIKGYGLKGRELLNLLWEDGASDAARKAPFLKSSVASKAREIEIPEVPKEVEDDAAEAAAAAASSSKDDGRGKSGSGSKLDSEAIKKKLSKFIRMPGKK